MQKKSVLLAYAGAALIAVAGLALSVMVFLQTAHGFGPQSTRPSPAPVVLPHTGPSPTASPVPSSGAVPGTRSGAGPSGPGGVQAVRTYPPGEPPGDIEDDSPPAPASAGPLAGAAAVLPTAIPALPSIAPTVP